MKCTAKFLEHPLPRHQTPSTLPWTWTRCLPPVAPDQTGWHPCLVHRIGSSGTSWSSLSTLCVGYRFSMLLCRRWWNTEFPVGYDFGQKKSTEMSSAALQITWTWSSDVNFCECHHQRLSMVSFHVRDYTDCTETCCCCDVVWFTVGWTRVLSLGQFLLLCPCSVDCMTTVTITRPLTNFTIMLWLSICPSHLLSVYRL